ncbi:5-(carboxyamino)imidazole ribonucleotide synthase [Neobacillus sp. LXY-4]|uniref:5-(carboxyamino)imidazole ribonucleotide synthase n=1 Tax=Neobacillus sp. LXY-4 TaxID=3379826 RepID=UPI003EDEC596
MVILPGQTIGIIGGGQLGRMMALAAKAQGFRIAVLDPVEDSPCGQVADYKVVGAYDDLEAIGRLADISDVITFEFENIDADALKSISNRAYIPQGTEVLEITKDRIKEKTAIQAAGIDVAPFAVIQTKQEIYDNIKVLGFPSVLKTSRGGYDGKGQLVIKSEADIAETDSLLEFGSCVLEKWMPFTKEVSVIVARSAKGETAVFPVGENIHINNILHQTIVPARISEAARDNALKAALQLVESLGMVGTLAVEMFVMEDDSIFINELAPRPHNSGHYSIDACETSQFEQHIRAICNWPLGSTSLLRPAVMVNILGEHQASLLENIQTLSNWKIHLYGKKEAKTGRKMGHVTLLRDTVEEAILEADDSQIWDSVILIGG